MGYGIKPEEIPYYEELESFFNQNFLAFLMFNRGFYRMWDAWVHKPGADFGSMLTIYDGHADHKGLEWMMRAHGAELDVPVQQFVDEQDGKSPIILLLCCNPENRGRITSQKSLVIYSRSSMNLRAMQGKKSRQIMHVPGHGDFLGTADEARLEELARSIKSHTYDI